MIKTITKSIAVLFFVSLSASLAVAQHNPALHNQHMMKMSVEDTRQVVNFPPAMRANQLANMRDHLVALNEIITALGQSNYEQAANIAEMRLGLSSPAAAGCSPADNQQAAQNSTPIKSMDEQMNELMPKGMRSIGAAMHQSASDFASALRQSKIPAERSKLAFDGLAKITQGCTSCHASYQVP